MKINSFVIAGAIFSIMLLPGCSSKSSNYRIPLPTVDIKANPSVKISTAGNIPELNQLARIIGDEFKRNGGQVVDGNADYWIVIYAAKEQRIDTDNDNKFNIIYSKEKKENRHGGEEFVVSRKFSTATNAHFVSIILYDVKTLTPMVNMDFPFYSSRSTHDSKAKNLHSINRIASSFINTMREILVFKPVK